jgi:hypothetical protein
MRYFLLHHLDIEINDIVLMFYAWLLNVVTS